MRDSAEFSQQSDSTSDSSVLTQQSDSTPLMEACCGGHVDVVRTLIQAGADVNALSSTRNTALIYACASGHLECIKELLSSGRCDLTLRNEAGHDALMEAANNGNVEIMNILIEHGAKPTYIIDGADYKEAAMDGHVDVAKLLLAVGSKVNLSTEPFENPLTLASCGGHLEYVALLCDAGANLEEANDEGFTPLMEASREGHYDVVKYLLDRGADVNAKTEDGLETSLTLAASGGFLYDQTNIKSHLFFRDVVELLVNRGGDLTLGERTPLYEACQEGRVEVSKFIISCLQKSLPLTNIQKDLNEALLCAVSIGNEELCDLLIESGAQNDCFSKENRTPLMEASRQNFLGIVELLIKKGADVNKIAPSVSKDLEPINKCSLKSNKNSKKLTQKDCCPALKCPCCIPPSLQKSAKEVCTAAGITTGPYSTTSSQMNMAPFSSVCSHSTVNPTNVATGGKRPAAMSRSNSPNAHKCTKSSSNKLNHMSATHKHQRSVSTSSSSATLSDPSAWMENATACNSQNNDTALTLACDGGHKELAALLIKRGAHLEHRDKKGFTPLILAATRGHEEVCRLLIEGGAQVDAQADRTKDTALSMSCSGGRSNVVALLLKHGANKEHRNLSDYTPLSLAASGGYVDAIQLLLTHGAEINSRTNSKLGISPLMLSAMNGHEEATRVLLESGSDINAQIETNKNTALTLACFQGRVEVTRLLISHGANVEHRAKTGLTPLMEAANGGYVEVGRVLLQANADVNTTPVPTSRDTALTIAADKGHHAFVALLLDYGAQINARNKKGCTALWLSCSGGHLETTQVLVDYKADTELQDNRKLTPLMIAFRKGHFKVVEYMVEHVLQFPSDGDCQRFILAQTDQDLINRCTQCMISIKEAKARQAEQANKAAASLLEMLAKEEALEESKKRTKQRQKEKKKAKKQAKKDEEDNVVTENELNNELEKISIKPVESLLTEHSVTRQQKSTENYKQEVLKQNNGRGNLSFQAENNEDQQKSVKQQKENPKNSNGVATSKTIKRTRTTSKKENINGNTPTPISTSNGHCSSAAIIPKKSEEEVEWHSANKKRSSVNKSVEPKPVASTPSNSMITAKTDVSEATSVPSRDSPTIVSMSQIPPLFPDDVFINENLSAIGGRRPSLQVLNIASSSIPRVIGRGGSNVNTIREATGAHVEVEKQCLRKEQTTRKITIKGAPEAVKNAIMMIDLLMKDHNMLVTDIVDRVISTTSASKSSLSTSTDTNTTNSGVSKHHQIPTFKEEIQKSPKQIPRIGATTTATITMNNSTGLTKTLKAVVPSISQTTPTTNIWQKRAEAIREKKNPQLNLTIGEKPFINHTHDIVNSTFGPTNVTCNNELKSIVGKRQGSEISDSTNELAALTKEEHQRKAPGYARPQSSMIPMNQLQHNNYNEKLPNGAPTMAPSLFDTITARWTSNALDAAEESDSPATGTIQNSWSYLLEERKNVSPQQIPNTTRITLPPSLTSNTASAGEKTNITEPLWNVNNGGTSISSHKQQYLASVPDSKSSDNGPTNSSFSVSTKPFMGSQTSNLIDSNNTQAHYTQTLLYQQKLQAQQFHQQQRIQRQNNWQPAQFGVPPASALMFPQIRSSAAIHQPMLNRYPSPSLQMHRQPPPGCFSSGLHASQQGSTYIYGQNTLPPANAFTQTSFTAPINPQQHNSPIAPSVSTFSMNNFGSRHFPLPFAPSTTASTTSPNVVVNDSSINGNYSNPSPTTRLPPSLDLRLNH
uniref:ANK_REP_REGION domain-containing protein n=1 Tax=Meloidogyne hapla TaxID=6305 RepID=A0A1I8BTT7_MELHA